MNKTLQEITQTLCLSKETTPSLFSSDILYFANDKNKQKLLHNRIESLTNNLNEIGLSTFIGVLAWGFFMH